MQTTCARKHNKPSQDRVILQQHKQVHFHKHAGKINHGACVSHRSWNKSITINEIKLKM